MSMNYFEDCIDCENRTPKCHSYCKLYKEAKKKQMEEKNRIARKNFENGEYYEMKQKIYDKRARRKR